MLSRVAGQRGAVQEPLTTALRGALSAGNACERNARFLVGVGASGAAVREPWPVMMGVMAERDASSNPVRSDFLFCFRRPRKIQTMVFRHTFYRGFPWVRVLAPDRVLTPEMPPAASKQRLASQSAVRAYFVPVRSPQSRNPHFRPAPARGGGARRRLHTVDRIASIDPDGRMNSSIDPDERMEAPSIDPDGRIYGATGSAATGSAATGFEHEHEHEHEEASSSTSTRKLARFPTLEVCNRPMKR